MPSFRWGSTSLTKAVTITNLDFKIFSYKLFCITKVISSCLCFQRLMKEEAANKETFNRQIPLYSYRKVLLLYAY